MRYIYLSLLRHFILPNKTLSSQTKNITAECEHTKSEFRTNQERAYKLFYILITSAHAMVTSMHKSIQIPKMHLMVNCAATSSQSLKLGPGFGSTVPSYNMIMKTKQKPVPIITPKPENESNFKPISHPKWNPIQRLAAFALDKFEDAVIANFLKRQHPFLKTVDPSVQISGNYAPVKETAPHHHLPMLGQIPSTFKGVYVCNGANPYFDPVGGHHLFDGDGMIHAVHFKDGQASYACRFTETGTREYCGLHIRQSVNYTGISGIARLLLFFTLAALGVIDATHGIGVANVGLI